MNPKLRFEVPDTPVRIRRPIELQPGQLNQHEQSRNMRLSLNRRVEQPIDLSSPITPKDDQRKRKSPSLMISIPESSNPESYCSKKGKNVVQEVEDESCRGSTFRDNKGKGKLDARTYNDGFQDLTSDQPGLNSPPRRVGQRLLVRSGVITPSNTARRNVALNCGGSGGGLNAPRLEEEHNRGPAGRDHRGKGKFDGDATNYDIQEISPDQSGSSVPPRPVRRRWLVRNGVIAPRNVAERNTTSNCGSIKDGATAPKQSELEAGQMVTTAQPSGVMLHGSGGQGRQPAGSSSVGGAEENAVLSEIVAGDPCGGAIRSRREPGATATSNTSSSRSTQSNRPRVFNQISTGSGRPNPAVSTASIHVTAELVSGASTSTNNMGEIGAHPQRGRFRSSSSLCCGGSANMTRNPGTQATNLNSAARARGRIFQGQGVVLQPVIDVDEIRSPDSGAAARAQQLAHDEMIARQLQEELYNETQGDYWSMEEMDARIAMSLQQEENAMCAAPIHRRASRVERSSQFVAASSLVRNNVAQQMNRDFNPHDYEALLALDEDNHRHTGASTSQINNLPESVVKSCNFDESCAVCLETPSIGEKIRHLPCLHKFHKDCIDQWLQRKKECPVCKCCIF